MLPEAQGQPDPPGISPGYGSIPQETRGLSPCWNEPAAMNLAQTSEYGIPQLRIRLLSCQGRAHSTRYE